MLQPCQECAHGSHFCRMPSSARGSMCSNRAKNAHMGHTFAGCLFCQRVSVLQPCQECAHGSRRGKDAHRTRRGVHRARMDRHKGWEVRGVEDGEGPLSCEPAQACALGEAGRHGSMRKGQDGACMGRKARYGRWRGEGAWHTQHRHARVGVDMHPPLAGLPA